MLDERMHNYPERYEKKPWCPSSKLIEICSSLARMKFTPEEFCTEKLENAVYSDGPLSWLKQGDFSPSTACAKVNQELTEQLKVVNEKIEEPSYKEAGAKLQNANNHLPEMVKIVKSYEEAQGKYNARKEIIDRWRKVIFETSVSTLADEKNVHFRRFENDSELTEDEIIEKVKQFKESLEKIIGFKEGAIGWWTGEVKNCPQAPKSRHEGPLNLSR